jgi:hypothetical protein
MAVASKPHAATRASWKTRMPPGVVIFCAQQRFGISYETKSHLQLLPSFGMLRKTNKRNQHDDETVLYEYEIAELLFCQSMKFDLPTSTQYFRLLSKDLYIPFTASGSTALALISTVFNMGPPGRPRLEA